MYFLNCGAYELAETQLRRAIWLNPYEPHFTAHLAWCLYKLNRHDDSLAVLNQVTLEAMDDEMASIDRLIRRGAAKRKKGPGE